MDVTFFPSLVSASASDDPTAIQSGKGDSSISGGGGGGGSGGGVSSVGVLLGVTGPSEEVVKHPANGTKTTNTNNVFTAVFNIVLHPQQ